MDHEQKYNAALERAKERYSTCSAPSLLEYIFPELKESEDERTRKELLGFIENWKNPNNIGRQHDYPMFTKNEEQCNKYIAWLEKQGERNFDYEHADIPQKDFAPIEPKFKVGDWIILPLGIIAHIDSINPTDYQVTTTDGKNCDFKISKQDNCRFWTIQDAKDGDVLATSNYIYIFNSIEQEIKTVSFYCLMKKSDEHFSFGDCKIHDEIMDSIPATKEQRDTLIKAMANAGYTFDFEKKELKKIESKTPDPDKVIEWFRVNWWDSHIGDPIDKFKKDFRL